MKDGATTETGARSKFEGDGLREDRFGILEDISRWKRAEAELRRAHRLESLRRGIVEVFLDRQDDDMYGMVLRLILKDTGSRFGVFGYIDGEGSLVEASFSEEIWDKCRVPDKTLRFPRETWKDSNAIWARAILQKKTLWQNEPGKVPKGHLPIDNVLTTPILYRNEVIGNLTIANRPGGYEAADASWLEEIARFIAPVLNARLERDRNEDARRRATDALMESEERYRSIHDHSPISIEMYDAQGALIQVNRAYQDLFGVVDPQEIRGLSLFDNPNLRDDLNFRPCISGNLSIPTTAPSFRNAAGNDRPDRTQSPVTNSRSSPRTVRRNGSTWRVPTPT